MGLGLGLGFGIELTLTLTLVKVLEESKSRYSTWFAHVTSDTLELMFGS